MKKSSKSRRDFLLKIFNNDSGLDSNNPDGTQNEKVKMLTPDGKLVEVDSRHLKNRQSASKTSNAEILKWMEEGKEKRKP